MAIAVEASACIALLTKYAALLVLFILVQTLLGSDGQIAVFDVETDLVLLEAGQFDREAVSLGVVRLADIGLHQVLGVLAKQRAVRTKETIVVKKFIKHIFTIDAGYHNNSSIQDEIWDSNLCEARRRGISRAAAVPADQMSFVLEMQA